MQKENFREIFLPIFMIVISVIMVYFLLSNLDSILRFIGESGAKIVDGFQNAKK